MEPREERRNARLAELFIALEKQQHQIDFLLNTYQVRWEKSQQQMHSLIQLYKQNTAADRQTREAIRAMRIALHKIQQSENQKYQLMQDASRSVKERVDAGERKQRSWLKQSNRLNLMVIIPMFVILLLYLKDELQAGELVNAWLAIIGAGGATIFGLATTRKTED